MPATILLATYEPDLLRAWWVAVPSGRSVITLEDLKGATRIEQDAPVVVVLDEAVKDRLPRNLVGAPTILVGDNRGSVTPHPSEAVKIRMNYLESRSRLAETLMLLEELAVLKSATRLGGFDARPITPPLPTYNPIPPRASSSHAAEDTFSHAQLWPFLNELADNLASPDVLGLEFRRLVRMMARCSHVAVFLRRPDGFRAAGSGTKVELFCPQDDAIIEYLQMAPVIVDGVTWPVRCSPLIESGVRNRMVAWGAKLVVPIHDNGWILGFLTLGVRDDGLPFAPADCERLTSVAGFFRRLLQQSNKWSKSETEFSSHRQLKEHLPQIILLKPVDEITVLTPDVIKKLIQNVRSIRQPAQLYPTETQPWRASAGYLAATQETWCQWTDVSEEMRLRAQRQRSERLALLHDIALTLNHELGNALVSLTALRHNPGAESNSPVLLAAIKRDIASLEVLNRHLASLPTFGDVTPETIDLSQLAQEIGRKTGVVIDAAQAPVMLCVVPPLVEFALESLIDSIAENRTEQGKRGLVLQLKGDTQRASFLIKGSNLILEGVSPAPEPNAVPTHGRISVFIAKEIIRLHGGSIALNSDATASTILITLCKW